MQWGALAILSGLTCLDKMRRLGEIAEFGCQVAAPALLVLAVRRGLKDPALAWTARIAVAATFFGHAVYAHGPYPLPGPWVDMTMAATGLDESAAVLFLRLAGVLDYAVAVGVFIPRIQGWVFAYAGLWGLLTALARPVANFRPQAPLLSLDPWLFECLVRLPNALVPLAFACLLWAWIGQAKPSGPASLCSSPSLSP